MGRPREFDEDRAVDAALEAFWRHGYQATSTRELCTATGLGRSSIYNTFTSKQDLFRRALIRYTERMTGRQEELLARLPIRAAALELMRLVIDNELGEPVDPRGCLVVDATLDPATREDGWVTAHLERDYRRRFAALRGALTSAAAAGELTHAAGLDTAAHLLIGAQAGIRAAARSGVGRPALEDMARTTVESLLG